MKKVALVFVLAVIVPSLTLAWLAVRSLRHQEAVASRQQTLLCQSLADSRAAAVTHHVEATQRVFARKVESLLKASPPGEVAAHFDSTLRREWPMADLGFVVALSGQVIAPSLLADEKARQFRLENDRFLCSVESCRVYWNNANGSITPGELDQPDAAQMPKGSSSDTANPKLSVEESSFRQLVGDQTDGTFARFLQDKLHVMLWHRAAADPEIIFGAQANMTRLAEELGNNVMPGAQLDQEICVMLLDDTGKPMWVSPPGLEIESRPSNLRIDGKPLFASAEIGKALPHWKVAVYPLNQAQLGRSADLARLIAGLLIALLVLAIGVGSWIIVADLRRQMTLARQKTDFVSNVSHELKTPLTSIRMFSEMLAEGRVQDAGKQRHFLGIIIAETARLTRLINNVLDFAQLERGEKKYQFKPCDVVALTRDTVEAYRPHLEANGFKVTFQSSEEARTLPGDRDALAQVLVNLLSNAEKYSGERKEIEVRLEAHSDSVEVAVSDRGPGVPRGCEERIFEQFYRAHDSLASGIQGSGLGLTLARQIARAHGGDVLYEPRDGGGSRFILKLPVKLAPSVKRET